jgi:hypothetical protein
MEKVVSAPGESGLLAFGRGGAHAPQSTPSSFSVALSVCREKNWA